MDEEDMVKTAFIIHHGFVKYTRMPFGLKNTPPTFQRPMDAIFASVKWQHATVYINGAIGIFKALENHLKHTEELLRLSMKAGVTIKRKRFNF